MPTAVHTPVPAYLPPPPPDAAERTASPPEAGVDRYAPAMAAELCRSCGDAVSRAYCAGCGQRRSTGRLTVRGVFDELVQQLAVVDRGLWYTALELTRDPGRMIRRYLDGDRRRFVGPITYLSILTAVELFVIPLVFGSLDGGLNATQAHKMSTGPHPLFTATQAAVYLRASQALSEQMLWTTLAMLVPFALAFRRAFRATGINAAEAAVFAVYTFAHAEVLYLLLVPVVRMAGGGNGLRFFVPTALFLVLATRASVTMFGGPPVRTGLRVGWAFAKSFAAFSTVAAVLLIVGIKTLVR